MTPIIFVILLASVIQVKVPDSFQNSSYISLTEGNEFSNSSGIVFSPNQAVNFNHYSQNTINYIFATILTIFLIAIVKFRRNKQTLNAPPWYMALSHPSRISLSGWKVSNLLYKSKLLYQ